MDPIQILKADRNMILYRPELNRITESAAGSILLQQILFRYDANGDKPFYKFKQPCKHSKYKPGDSWCEELGFSRYEFDKSLSVFSQKVNKGTKRDPDALVWFWTDRERITWYEVNLSTLRKVVGQLYVKSTVNFSKSRPSTLHIKTETTRTETTKTEKEKNSVELKKLDDVPDDTLGDPLVNTTTPLESDAKESVVNVVTSNNIPEDVVFAKRAIDMINEIGGRQFRYATGSLDPIRSRYKQYKRDGHPLTLEEVELMIRYKVKEWKGTDFSKFIDPKTLFRKSNLESYLVASKEKADSIAARPKITFSQINVTVAMLDEFVEKTGKKYEDYDTTITHEENLNA